MRDSQHGAGFVGGSFSDYQICRNSFSCAVRPINVLPTISKPQQPEFAAAFSSFSHLPHLSAIWLGSCCQARASQDDLDLFALQNPVALMPRLLVLNVALDYQYPCNNDTHRADAGSLIMCYIIFLFVGDISTRLSGYRRESAVVAQNRQPFWRSI